MTEDYVKCSQERHSRGGAFHHHGWLALKTENRTLALFEFFAREQHPSSLTDIARGLDMPMSSCFNLVKSLQLTGFLYSVDGKRRFYPTRKLYDIASALVESDPWISRVEAELETLQRLTHETVIFGKRQGSHVVFLKVLEGTHQVRFHAKVGDVVPLLSSAQGRAILSQMPIEERQELVRKISLEKLTRTTVTDRKILLRILDEAQKAGYVVLHGEVIAELDAIAMPVKINGDIHTIVLAGPSSRMTRNMAKYKKHLMAACQNLMESD
jgi:IclR family acetate operon transcriptional repressor